MVYWPAGILLLGVGGLGDVGEENWATLVYSLMSQARVPLGAYIEFGA